MIKFSPNEKILSGFCLVFSVFILVLTAVKIRIKKDSLEEAYKSVYRVTNAEGTSGGTGFRVASGALITNEHVCAISKDGKMFTKDFEGRPGISDIIEMDKNHDLCLLSAQFNENFLRVAKTAAQRFQTITSVGHPLLEDVRPEKGVYIADVLGTIGKPTNKDGACEDKSEVVNTFFGVYCLKHMILSETNIRTFPGNSGSPVLNEQGEVVGVINSGNSDTNNGAYIPYADLRRFLIENNQKVF